MILRHQLPAYSPLGVGPIREALVHGLGPGMDGQADLRAALAREYCADEVRLLGSGTQALQVALGMAMRQVRDTAVALPAFTCFDVAAAAVGARARLRFYDVEPRTLAPDLASLERTLHRGTRVVVVTPLYGFPVDWDAVDELLTQYGAFGVEDAAQGDDARWRGRRVGSLGPISVLSFGRGKGWTGGSGGALLLRNRPPWQGLATTMVEPAEAPMTRGAEVRVVSALMMQWALGRPAWYAIPHALPWLRLGETVYRAPEKPRVMTRAASACLTATRAAAAREGATRRATATAMVEAIGTGSVVRPIEPLAGATPGYLRLPLRLAHGLGGFPQPGAVTRVGLARSYPSVLAVIPQAGPLLDDTPSGWPGAAELVRTLWTVPTHSLLTAAERSLLVRQLQAYDRRG